MSCSLLDLLKGKNLDCYNTKGLYPVQTAWSFFPVVRSPGAHILDLQMKCILVN